MKQWVRAGLAAVLATALTVGIAGCGDDMYGECTIDSETMDHCVDDDDEEVSCVVQQHLECQTGACGRYRGSDAFCTAECADDGDCRAGECRSFLMTSEQKYCVADSDLEELE